MTVLTVPADYSGTASTAYLQAFAAHLDPSIVVMWTGTAFVAPTIKIKRADRPLGREGGQRQNPNKWGWLLVENHWTGARFQIGGRSRK